ncbi:MAG: cob(I)yrinic acid a,c-diamide adenosyltransferase [Chitinophagales bacterium]|jgi:cob(I)alamin adenosyltransferase|nr:cob(I)yrinic acid a,c-diamide adenosyltransferase [Chitinophagales bacterium]
MKIYTKTGDDGSTMLFGGGRVSKAHLRIETYGTTDELNAHVGLLRDHLTDTEHRAFLHDVQNMLFVVGANLATNPEKTKAVPPPIAETDITAIEREIDRLDALLPPLRHFLLPGGHVAVSTCHIARCVCRRAERLCVALADHEWVSPLVIHYLNRLSDYLFMLSRSIALQVGAEEIKWVSR